MTTLLVAEHDNKTLKDSTNKALTAAKALGLPVHVLVAGKAAARSPKRRQARRRRPRSARRRRRL
jgi:electron transfer flavoprotein alpha subunit